MKHKMALLGNGTFLLCMCNMLTVVQAKNPLFFPCENDTHSIVVDCKNRQLTSIPAITSASVLSLNLDGNKIQRVKSNAFTGVLNLQNISIMWNCLPGRLRALGSPPCHMEIEMDAFVNLKNLSHLYLAGNSLKSIPSLPDNLKLLSLEFNHIFRIIKLLGTPRLKQLLLAKNCYYANPCNQTFFISEAVFQDLPDLRNLTLGFNNLTMVPLGLPQSLESLDLKENKIGEIGETAFANLTRLRNLNLEWNCQRCDHAAQPCFPCQNNSPIKLHPRAFQNQGQVAILSLRGNSLKELPDGLFCGMRSLTSLDLSDNLLAYVIRNGTFFRELKNVKSLNLIYNYQPLKTFRELILSPYLSEMTSLQELKLVGYFFHELTNDSLRPLLNLTNLENLDLRMNFISSCSLKIFSAIKTLKKVVLSQNMLDFTFYESATGQSNLQNQKLSDGAIILLERMKTEDERVEMESEYFLNPDLFTFKRRYCQGRLIFDLSQNNILTLRRSIFEGMGQIICLDLSLNYLSQSLNGLQFLPLRNLIYLNMAHNRIDLYYDGAFQELRKTLRVLDLSNNDFHFRMKGMGHRFEFIQNLTSLKVLSLSENNIGLRISMTLQSSSLEYLYFSGNRLDIMWDTKDDQYIHFFKKLSNLVYLDISRNQLTSFSPDAFCNLPQKLKTLKVNNNHLKYFPWHNISFLHHLHYLNLSGNSLSDLPNDGAELGHNLTVLDLSYNKIQWLPEVFFQEASSLSYLLLSHNNLKFLNAERTRPQFSVSLQRLTLDGNPFTCSCDTSWFVEFLRTSTVQIPYLTTGIRCGFPESQQGETVLSMDPRSCQEIFGSVGFLCTSFLTIALTMVPLLKKLYGWDLWYCIQVLWAGYKGYSQLRDYPSQHDAFVVFDTGNVAVRDWVYNELTINLENRGRQRFKLCLEERDWVPGISCIENLHNAVYSCRKTVFVLTNTGSVSGIPRQAFLMVQQRLLDEKKDTVVLVLLDEVFPKLKYLQMRKMLCRKSVLSWPRNPHAHQHFWNRMRAILTSDNCRSYSPNMSESLLSNNLI